jgi:hypothetical protein
MNFSVVRGIARYCEFWSYYSSLSYFLMNTWTFLCARMSHATFSTTLPFVSPQYHSHVVSCHNNYGSLTENPTAYSNRELYELLQFLCQRADIVAAKCVLCMHSIIELDQHHPCLPYITPCTANNVSAVSRHNLVLSYFLSRKYE